MSLAPSAVLLSSERKRERDDIRKRRVEFDEALEELRRAKQRLQVATDLYLERLEGTKDRAQRNP